MAPSTLACWSWRTCSVNKSHPFSFLSTPEPSNWWANDYLHRQRLRFFLSRWNQMATENLPWISHSKLEPCLRNPTKARGSFSLVQKAQILHSQIQDIINIYFFSHTWMGNKLSSSTQLHKWLLLEWSFSCTLIFVWPEQKYCTQILNPINKNSSNIPPSCTTCFLLPLYNKIDGSEFKLIGTTWRERSSAG